MHCNKNDPLWALCQLIKGRLDQRTPESTQRGKIFALSDLADHRSENATVGLKKCDTNGTCHICALNADEGHLNIFFFIAEVVEVIPI